MGVPSWGEREGALALWDLTVTPAAGPRQLVAFLMVLCETAHSHADQLGSGALPSLPCLPTSLEGAGLGPLLSPGSCQPRLCPTWVLPTGGGKAGISAGPGQTKVSIT